MFVHFCALDSSASGQNAQGDKLEYKLITTSETFFFMNNIKMLYIDMFICCHYFPGNRNFSFYCQPQQF